MQNKLYKVILDGYILYIGIDCGGTEITEEEYNEIKNIIDNKPIPKEGYGMRLKVDLTWEEYLIPVPEPEEGEGT